MGRKKIVFRFRMVFDITGNNWKNSGQIETSRVKRWTANFCDLASEGPVIIMHQLKSIYNSPFKDSRSHPFHTCFAMISSHRLSRNKRITKCEPNDTHFSLKDEASFCQTIQEDPEDCGGKHVSFSHLFRRICNTRPMCQLLSQIYYSEFVRGLAGCEEATPAPGIKLLNYLTVSYTCSSTSTCL